MLKTSTLFSAMQSGRPIKLAAVTGYQLTGHIMGIRRESGVDTPANSWLVDLLVTDGASQEIFVRTQN